MNKFFKLLKNSTRIKKWILLIIIGMVLTCYGFSKVLVLEKLEIKELAQIIGTFVIGCTCFIIGLVYIQRRTLQMAIEANNTNSNSDKKLNSINEKAPKIVVIGGGTGIAKVLQGIKNYTNNITAIVTVSNYGKKTDNKIDLKPTEDIRESIIALANNTDEMKKIMNYEFKNSGIEGLKFGELYLSAMQNIYGEFANSIEKNSNILSIGGKVLPVTLDEMTICAELEDGTIIEEKDRISEIVSDKVTKIHRVYINPSNCRTTPGVVEALKEADCIIIGPGSLYTNVIPNLLIKNVAKTIKESKAIKVYISNIMTQLGQTDDYSVSEHINAITEHVGEGIINYCICDTGEVVPEYIRKYNKNGAMTVEIDTSNIKKQGIELIKENLSLIEGEYVRHNPEEIAKIIIQLLCNDLKFKDKQSDEQYLLLNSKLKEKNEKEKNKKTKKNKPKKDNKKFFNKKSSKFSSRYNDRIKSIKESEETRKQNVKIYEKAEELISKEEQEEKEKFLKETYKK